MTDTSAIPGSGVAPDSTEEIAAEDVPLVCEQRKRRAKTVAQAMMPYTCGQIRRSGYSGYPDSPELMFARKSTTGRKSGRPRGGRGAKNKPRSAETEIANGYHAGKVETTTSTGCIELHSNLTHINEGPNLEVLQECPKDPEINGSEAFDPEPKAELGFKCSVQLSEIHVEPKPMADDNIDTASSSDEWMENIHLEAFPERGAEQPLSGSGNSSEKSRKPEPVDIYDESWRHAEASSGKNQEEDSMIPKIVVAEIKTKHRRNKKDPNELKRPNKTSNDVIDNATSQIVEKFEASWLESNSTAEMIKPKKKRVRRPKCKPQVVPELAKTNENHGVETENVERLTTAEICLKTTQGNRSKTKRKSEKPRSSQNKRMKLDVMETTNFPTNFEAERTIEKKNISIDELQRLLKLKIEPNRPPEKKAPKKLRTSEIILTKGGAQVVNYPQTTKKISKTKDQTGEPRKEIDQLVAERTFDDGRGEKTEKYVLRKRHRPRSPITNENRHLLVDPSNLPQLVLWNVAYSKKLTKKQKLMLNRAKNPECKSQRSFKKTTPEVDEDKLTTIDVSQVKTGTKRRGRKKKTAEEPRLSIKTTTVLTKEQKKMIGQRALRLLRRREPIRCPDTIGTNANESGVLSALGNDRSSIRISNVESIAIFGLPRILVLGTPMVAASTDNSSSAIGQSTQFGRPQDSLVTELKAEQANRFGCSSFNVTDLSSSFVELVDDQTGIIAKLDNGSSVFQERSLQENEYEEEKVTLYAAPRLDEDFHSTTSNALESEQTQNTQEIPTKASLPASNDVTVLTTTGVKQPRELEFSLESNETQVDPIIHDVNLSQASDREDKSAGVLQDMCGLDTDVLSPEVQNKSGTEESVQKKIMPMIIANKLLPKGSMELGFISCRYPGGSTSRDINNEIDSIEEIRELTIHNQSAFTSVVNLPTIDAVDDSQRLEDPDAEPTLFSHPTQQQDTISIKSVAQSNNSAETNEPNFDPLKLWKICPEFKEFDGDEDVANNNNDKSSNLDADINDKVIDNVMESKSYNMDASISEYDASRGVIATKDCLYEMRSESSASIVSCRPPTSSKASTIVDLTTTNLKNFTNMLNRHEMSSGLNWSVERCRRYLLPENDPDGSAPDAGTEPGGKAAESTCKSETEFSQAGSKKIKRRWTKDKSDSGLEQTQVKRVKLNRKAWSHDRHEDSRNFVGGSVCSDKAVASNSAKDTVVGRKDNDAETIEETENLEEKSGYSKGDLNLEEFEETLQICETNKFENGTNLSSTICLDTNVHPVTETPNCAVDEETLEGKLILFQGKLLKSTSSQETQDKDECRRSDANKMSSSSGSSSDSSSSSSGSRSSSSTTSRESSSDTKDLNEEQKSEDSVETEINQGTEDEVDDDVLSLGADSLFTMYDDRATDLADANGKSPFFEPSKELSCETYQDMTNVGVYFENNIRECDEAYKACIEENRSVGVQGDPVGNGDPTTLWAGPRPSTLATVVQGSNIPINANLDQRLRPLTSFPKYSFPNPGKDIFAGHCFMKLRIGMCSVQACRFSHNLLPNLQNLEEAHPQKINEVISVAIRRGFKYFIGHLYSKTLNLADYVTRVRLFHKLIEAGIMTEPLLKMTFSLLNQNEIPVIEFLKNAATMMDEKNETLGIDLFWKIFGYVVPPGAYWTTLKDLLIRKTPTILSAHMLMNECIRTSKEKSHIEDVYTNYIKKLTPEQVAQMDTPLQTRFQCLLVEHNLIHHLDTVNVPASDSNPAVFSPQTILSPDDTHRTPNLCLPPDSPAHEREHTETPEASGVDASSSTYVPKPIDDLPPPCSAWRKMHFSYHMSMANLISALKVKEYAFVLRVLDEYSDTNEKSLYTSACYRMLRKNVMTSAHHVEQVIQLSVRMGATKFTRQTLSNLGMYLMIELCNSNAWVLAYGLFKSLRYYDLTEKVAAFALISVEVCLANRRPLKAFNILKQNNMFSTRRNKWNVAESNPKDEEYRVMVISLLLEVLCEEYPDHAYYIFKHILAEQTRNYHPIDLTACVDKLVLSILKGNSEESIPEIGRLVIEHNFMLEKSTFQALVVSVFKHDILLSKRLYCYGTWIGVYSLIQLKLPLRILIKTDMRREEMYLVVADFVDKLSMDMGPAVDRLGPNHFNIYLIFELTPFKKRPVDDSVEMWNNDELKASKQLMKTVLKEDFNPPLKTIMAEQERTMKLQSRSVVNYLKSMNA